MLEPDSIGLTLFWLSGRPVTVWTSRKLSDSAIEYGLMRNAALSKKFHATSTHITLLHFVAITVIPLIWIIDIAFSEAVRSVVKLVIHSQQNISQKFSMEIRSGHG